MPLVLAASAAHDMKSNFPVVWVIYKKENGKSHTYICMCWCIPNISICTDSYVNMDYLFFSVLKDSPLKCFNVSYDIACQWSRHLWKRMETLPIPMRFPYHDRKVTTLVPKFHLPAHIAECQWKYSFNYIKGVGRTDGEAPERSWSTLNAAASSTKEMGPGHRRNTLDDLIGDSNWKKFIGLGKCFQSYLAAA